MLLVGLCTDKLLARGGTQWRVSGTFLWTCPENGTCPGMREEDDAQETRPVDGYLDYLKTLDELRLCLPDVWFGSQNYGATNGLCGQLACGDYVPG